MPFYKYWEMGNDLPRYPPANNGVNAALVPGAVVAARGPSLAIRCDFPSLSPVGRQSQFTIQGDTHDNKSHSTGRDD
jgi:hypothetical protein